MTKVDSPSVPVCAVIVTHNPDAGWPRRLAVIAAETPKIVVVDNRSQAAELAMIKDALSRHPAHLIVNQSNMGLAFALNQGAGWAFGEGYKLVLLLDQDTEPFPGIAAELLRVFRLADAEARTAVVGSNYREKNTEKLRFPLVSGGQGGWTRTRTVITSGSLVECGAFAEVGPFREDFFVDSVDHDFCLRARAKGLQVVLATRPLMRHSLGLATSHKLAGVTFVTCNNSAHRRYYIARNRVILIREHLWREPKWALAAFYALASHLAAILLFERERAAKVHAMARGAWHGLLGRPAQPPKVATSELTGATDKT